jgi:hypothetical protein
MNAKERKNHKIMRENLEKKISNSQGSNYSAGGIAAPPADIKQFYKVKIRTLETI